MSLLLVGMSHRTAPLATLGQVAVPDRDRPGLLAALLASRYLSEVMVVSTCNRLEVYTETDDPTAGAADIRAAVATYSGVGLSELRRLLCVDRGMQAVQHLFEVATGLDSLVVGDEQVLGQVRRAYLAACDAAAAGRTLHPLAQQALRVGKQVRTRTGLAKTGASVVSVALRHAAAALGGPGLAGRRSVVLGAGATGALAVAHLHRSGVSQVLVANRTPSRADALAATAGLSAVQALSSPDALTAAVSAADVLVLCTSSPASGTSAELQHVHAALARRTAASPLVICDLGLPRNLDPQAAALPGVVLVDLHTVQGDPWSSAHAGDLTAARNFVTHAVTTYASA